MRSTAALLVVSSLFSSAFGATYNLKDSFVGEDFLNAFTHEAIPDPTQGRVNYVDQTTALAQNLSFATDDTFIMRADSFTTLDPNGPGRNSVRIKSNSAYTTHVSVYNIRHMPQGCSTWPAAWEVDETTWPNGGEVDILEGSNDIEPNQSTLHTSANCAMPDTGRTMTGTSLNDNCDVAADGNIGCGVHATKPNSYGKSFNAVGGGFYAMERTSTFINVWFWARDETGIPADVTTAGATVNTDAWGVPTATFVNAQCDIDSHFDAHNIIINLTFCGQWAGLSQFFNDQAGCPGDCNTFVDQNPGAFDDAFWDLAGIHVYS